MASEKAKVLTKKLEDGQQFLSANNIGEAIKAFDDAINLPLVAPDELTEETIKLKESACY